MTQSTALPLDRSEMAPLVRLCASVSLLAFLVASAGCDPNLSAPGQNEHGDGGGDPLHPGEPTPPGELEMIPAQPSFFSSNTVSQRVGLPLTAAGTILNAPALAKQLAGYDPGSLLRCELAGQAAYDAAIDAWGGVRWGYSVSVLEDLSKPKFLAGFQKYERVLAVPGAATDSAAAAPVEIAVPDVVAVTESAALFYSPSHGLMLVDLSGGQPRFQCATQLPGRVDQFFFKDGELVAMIQANGSDHSALLHFRLDGSELRFVEALDLGRVQILDSRRFNDKLVFYTDLKLAPAPAPAPVAAGGPLGASNTALAPVMVQAPQSQHRALRVFRLGETLQEEMYDTLIDTTPSPDQLASQVTRETAPDVVVNESRRFGQVMWASDHYFVVTEDISKTYVAGWHSSTYSTCTASHTVPSPYDYCWTEYETRPNPDYTPPDNSGGDRSCQGATLSDCLVAVARVSNRTIQVPVGRRCEERTRYDWICDAREQRTTEYPEFRSEESTQLYIYEYTDAGFVRVDSSVHEITTPGLDAQSPDAQVATLTTSTEAFDLAVPGAVQTLYFQDGYLYVISQGLLQVYALGGSSIVRSATLPVVNESLQSALFSGNRLYLSDFGWGGGDHSTLRVVNLSNPAFPSIEASTHSLPGGHRSILASDYGIFTIGSVAQFQGQSVNAIKLGLFSDPFVDETAYLILATDLSGDWLADEKAQFFAAGAQRMLLPYSGQDQQHHSIARVGVSHLQPDQIVSEGAVIVPEVPQRLRPIPGAAESYLSFAANSIEWLTPKEQQWQTTPVLEYFQPNALYRISDQDDYVELQRLGDRCRLFFANATNINLRASGAVSADFACFGWGTSAYANTLLFSETGVEFDARAHSVRILGADEIADTRARIAERPVCLLSTELVSDTRVDPDTLSDARDVVCMSPTEYQQRLNELSNQKTTP
jgi:hypothetical protein